MVIAAAAPNKPGPKISYDALLVAGAGLLGVMLLMRGSRGTQASSTGYAPAAPMVDASALEQGILGDPAFWSALSQQQALNAPLQSAPAAPSPTGLPTNGGQLSQMPPAINIDRAPSPGGPLPLTIPGLGAHPDWLVGQGNVVGAIEQPGGGVDIVTSTGAVYALGGAQYYGGTNPGSIGAPWHAGTIVAGEPLAGGGYSLVNAQGATYNFGPLPGQSHP